jgi:surfeit locus 1 family protein
MTDIRYGNWQFTLRPAMAVAAVAGMIIMVLLGNWQTRRAEEKLALQQRLDARTQGPVLLLTSDAVVAVDYQYARVAVRGEFSPQRTVFVDNRVLKGLPGYHVVTPLRIGGSDMYVLVNRGWIALGPSRTQLPEVVTPSGELVLQGIAVIPPEHVFELGPEQDGVVVQHLSVSKIAKRMGLKLQPIVLQQTSNTPDGLARVWNRPDAGADTNRAYALQWYAMAALIAALYTTLNVRRRSE